MNQRSKRARDRKRESFVSMATGGHNTLRETTGSMKGIVQLPPAKATDKSKREGLAKASPAFKAVKPVDIPSAEDQQKALAENDVAKAVEKELDKREKKPKAEGRRRRNKKATGDIKTEE